MKLAIKPALVLAVAASLSFMTANAQAGQGDGVPYQRIKMQPGDSLQDTLFKSHVQAKSAQLRAEWLASGKQVTNTLTNPVLLGGTVLSPTVTVGDPLSFPSLQFDYVTGTSGLNAAEFIFSSPDGIQTIGTSYQVGQYTTHGRLSFAYTVQTPLYSQPGTWTLTAAVLYDFAGNSHTYTAKQLGNLFSVPSFTMVNTGVYDATPPHIFSAQLNTTTVSIAAQAPQMIVNFAAYDGGSGLYEALLQVQPPGQTYSYAEIAPLALPVKSGTVTAFNSFYTYDTPGTWTIVSYVVCDVAFNCTASKSSQQVQALLGTTTFTVTN